MQVAINDQQSASLFKPGNLEPPSPIRLYTKVAEDREATNVIYYQISKQVLFLPLIANSNGSSRHFATLV
jgi:hypothetical protein